jgi:hypothetical protein
MAIKVTETNHKCGGMRFLIDFLHRGEKEHRSGERGETGRVRGEESEEKRIAEERAEEPWW